MKNYIIAYIVLNEVKREYGVTSGEISSKTRVANVRRARQVFTQLMREHSTMTLDEIGLLVNRDHSTVSTTSIVVRKELSRDNNYRERYIRVKQNIKNQIEDGKELC